MRPLALGFWLLAAPLGLHPLRGQAQERPEPGLNPAFRAQMEGMLRRDPLDSWRNYLKDGIPAALVEVVATYTEEELSDMAFHESVAMLHQGLREMWGQYGSATSREHRVTSAGDSPARVYPLGRPLKP
ncbi:MAG: hypothetical protein HYZ13_14050 [Acidobacteria bacterium]|nr:hypothetical protein [Acidobacteriota bacterium]